MSNVEVNESNVKVGGLSYFRGGAEETAVGAIGEKRSSVVNMNYIDVKGRIPTPKIKKAKTMVVGIDFNKTSRNAFNTAVSAIVKGVPVSLSGNSAFSQLKSGKLKLVKFSATNNDIKDAANKSPKVLNDLIAWGKDARIVHQVFYVMDADLANQFAKNGSADLSIGVKGLEAKVGGSGSASGGTKVTIGNNTAFAYLLLKIDWDAKMKKNRSKIVDLDTDQWSFG